MASSSGDGHAAPAKQRIGEMLLEAGLINERQLNEALARMKASGGKIVENLIALNYLDSHAFVRFLSSRPGIASIDLMNYTIPKEVVEMIPPEYAIAHELLPLDKMGRYLTIGMACPLDVKTIEELEQMTGLRVRPLLVSMSDIREAIKAYYHVNTGPKAEDMSLEYFGLTTPTPKHAPAVPQVTETVTSENALASIMQKVECTLHLETVLDLVRQVTSLPALPETITQIHEAMGDPNTSVGDVAAILSRDPALSAKLLSLANSSAFAFMYRVDSVELATSLLGLREVYTMALSAAVVDYFAKSKTLDYKKFWRDSFLSAKVAGHIGQCAGLKNPRSLSSAGLLHDLGIIVLAEIAPERYAEVGLDCREESVVRREHELFTIAHPEIGYVLAQNWSLPDEIAAAIRFHHDFQSAEEYKETVAAVALSSMSVDAAQWAAAPGEAVISDAMREAAALLGLDDDHLIMILGFTQSELDALSNE